ncbi:hypothetical protein KUCAC02_029275, partial [Chaenocephalus aceratus]
MPSRHYIAEKGIPALHTKVREKVQRLTAHWIDSSFTLHNVVLHASELRGSYTSMRIRNAIEEMLAMWDIDNDKVHVVLRDNAANMKKEIAKEALIREVEIMERKRKAGSEVSAEEPPRKSPRRSGVGCAAANSSFVSLYDEILEGNVVESRPVSTSAVVTQVEAYLAEQTIP